MSDIPLEKCYRILEVRPGVSPAEVKSAYVRLKKLYADESPVIKALTSEFTAEDKASILAEIEDAHRIIMAALEQPILPPRPIPDIPAAHPAPAAPPKPIEPVVQAAAPSPPRETPAQPSLLPSLPQPAALLKPAVQPVPPVTQAPVKPAESPRPPAPAATPFPDSSGPMLKLRREIRGVSLHDIYVATKIRVEVLENIEADKFEALADISFLRTHLVQYARFIGLDPKETTEQYLVRYADWRRRRAQAQASEGKK